MLYERVIVIFCPHYTSIARGPATRYFSVPILATILIFHDQLRKRGTENSVKIDLEQGAERNRCLMAMARSMKKQKSC